MSSAAVNLDQASSAVSIEPIGAGDKRRFASIDALRCVMCVGIALNHFVPYFFEPGDMELHVANYFSYFTDLFAVFAGLFAAPYLCRQWNIGSYYKFIVRKMGRLYPLHLVTTMFYVFLSVPIQLELLTPQNAGRYSLEALIPHLTLTHAWGHGPAMAFNYPSWMISAIFGCYLLLPFLSSMQRTSRWAMVPLLIVVVAVSVICAWMLGSDITRLQKEGLGILRAAPSFLFGIVLGQWRVGRPSKSRSFLLIALTMLLAFSTPTPLAGAARLILVYTFAYSVLLLDSSGLRAPSQLATLQAGAKFSFGVYLWHGLVATVLFRMALPRIFHADLLRVGDQNPFLAYGLIICGVAAAFLLAAISLRTIERHGGRFFIWILRDARVALSK
jgi:peptidoglycan/LPS O-acetylase OafA/YrhL